MLRAVFRRREAIRQGGNAPSSGHAQKKRNCHVAVIRLPQSAFTTSAAETTTHIIMSKKLLTFVAIATVAAASITSARAELIYAVNGNNQLITFDSSAPGTILSRQNITNTGGDSILNIDFRPANGVLYGLSGNNSLYIINPMTGAATFVGTTTITGGFDYGFDFNPAADRIRVATDAGGNFRINQTVMPPATIMDGNFFYVAGDPNAGITPQLAGAAYTNNVAGASSTQLFYIDFNLDILVFSPDPNGGSLQTRGALGINVTGLMGFDISGVTGDAFASLSTDGVTSSLYRIDLTTGAATLVGSGGIGAGETILDISAAPIPEPSAYALILVSAVGLFLVRRGIAKRASSHLH